ncbi:MAG: helix-turn-helix domain-containing protein [Sarcina ventriculi]
MINNIEIGKRIKEIRNDKKLNQREFAKRLTLSQNHISYLEKGIRKITEKFINDLCKEYNVNKEWLLTGTGEKYIDMIEGLNIDDEEIKNFLKKFMQLDMKTKVAIMNIVDYKANE